MLCTQLVKVTMSDGCSDDKAPSTHSSMLSVTLTPCRLYDGRDVMAVRPSAVTDTSPCMKLTLRRDDGGEP